MDEPSFDVVKLPRQFAEGFARAAEAAREPLEERAAELARFLGTEEQAARAQVREGLTSAQRAVRDAAEAAERALRDLLEPREEAQQAHPAYWHAHLVDAPDASPADVEVEAVPTALAGRAALADLKGTRAEAEAIEAREELRVLAEAARATSEKRRWNPGAGGP
jgi:hypothetical protein